MEKILTNITELEHAGMRFFASRTGARDIVSIEGSVFGGWNMLPRAKCEVPVLVAELLDAGTSTKSKDVIREALGARGASLSFSPGGDRLYFSGSCLPEDVSFLLKMIAECLSDASFPAAEIKTAKERALGDLEEEKTQTRSLASAALARLLYDASHVNYAETISLRRKSIESITRTELIAFRKTLGQGGLVLAITGDIQPTDLLQSAKLIMSKLPKGTASAPVKKPNTKKQTFSTELISVKDKANIDVYLGVAVPLTREHELFLPYMVLNEMLGSRGFTSHLMMTIRERDGLTYGVYAMPSGFGGSADGSFQIWATFSPQKFEESVKALRKEVALFFKELLTRSSLEARKLEMIGEYTVGLSTTRGLASMLHKIGTENKELSYIDEYPELLKVLTLEDLHKATALIPLSKLSLAAAGTFTK
jgi:zinc protease